MNSIILHCRLAMETRTAVMILVVTQIRFRSPNNSDTGFIFESSNETRLMSIRGSDGNTYIKGDTRVSGKVYFDNETMV